ncbi:MAG: hypothetical protein FWH46_04215 [Methanimicrococcus sp.]|nr:hypothetical protein [Methanimicrococcus sp.]
MESIAYVLLNGLKSLKNNTILFVPPFAFVIIILIGSIAFAFSANFFFPSLNKIWLVFAYVFFIIFIIGAFAIAGQIGMAKEIASTGKTNMSHFISYGMRFFGRVFAANIILLLLATPFIALLYFPNTSLYSPKTVDLILIGICIIVMNVLFFFVNYNIVVDDISTIAGFKKSLSLLKAKTSQVLLFIVVFYIVSYTLRLIASILWIPITIVFEVFDTPSALAIVILLMILIAVFHIVIEILTIVWITRFYMAITEKPLYVKEKITNY